MPGDALVSGSGGSRLVQRSQRAEGFGWSSSEIRGVGSEPVIATSDRTDVAHPSLLIADPHTPTEHVCVVHVHAPGSLALRSTCSCTIKQAGWPSRVLN